MKTRNVDVRRESSCDADRGEPLQEEILSPLAEREVPDHQQRDRADGGNDL